MTVTTQMMIKYSNSEGLTHEEQSLLGWIHSRIFRHSDGETEWSVFPIGEILLVGGDALSSLPLRDALKLELFDSLNKLTMTLSNCSLNIYTGDAFQTSLDHLFLF